MLLFVTTAHETALRYHREGFGRLVQPRACSRVADTAAAGIPWAADNDCFQGLDADRYRKMLDKVRGVPGCRFVTAPDVVGRWRATRRLWDVWRDELDGMPRAYVAQDGQPARDVPWDELAALFIGGTTEYKLSGDAERLGCEAKDRGLWLHMGRVNSRKRVHYARAVGCDSVDGTQFSMFLDRWVPEGLRWASEPLQGRRA